MARIMIVDDDEDVLVTLRVLLKNEGHSVIPITEGLEAMERLNSLDPIDLMLVDLRMAPVDGLELIEHARKARPNLGIIVVSAYLDDAAVQRILDMGCTAYIRKPFTAEDVLDNVREVLLETGVTSSDES